MREQPTSSAEEEPPRLGDQIDIACDWFEAELRKGNSPRIEDLLMAMTESGRSQLLKELVAIEIAVARERLQPVDFQAYLERFPQYGDVLTQLRSELDNPGLHSATTISASDAVNSDTATMECLDPEPSKHFELHVVAGEGGFGKVWRAYDTKLQRDVAVKIPHQDRPTNTDIAAVLTEARAAARLDHPNIVTVHQVGEGDANQPPFIVTAFIDGPNLRTWLQSHQMTPQQVAKMVSEIAEALGHAHSRNITHCDVKPGNVLIDSAGKPHLTDFGLAKRMTKESATDKFRAGGTLPYMSPEQASRRPDLDYRTDIYSLGVMLYELLTGRRPFLGDTDSVHDQIINAPPKRLRELKSTIPEDLEKVCLKCLAKNPADRYQTGDALAEDLRRWMNGESLRGIPISLPKRAIKLIKRHRRLVVSFIATAMGALGIAFTIWWSTLPPSPGRLVQIQTNPPGCEITLVTLDPSTGDPDPQQIQSPRGRTPLRMKLAPGDYLIVAVLDQDRFSEVMRHVPAVEESIPLADRHLNWQMDSQGVLLLPLIRIGDRDTTGQMAYIEGSNQWRPPATGGYSPGQKTWIVPPFYVDVRDRTAGTNVPEDRPGLLDNRFGRANWYLEDQGKRLPTAMELLYLKETVNRRNKMVEDNVTPPPQGAVLSGLYAPPWEWTITKSPLGEKGVAGQAYRIVGGGAAPFERPDGNEERLIYAFKGSAEWRNSAEVGLRGFRSVRPRRRAIDFFRVVGESTP